MLEDHLQHLLSLAFRRALREASPDVSFLLYWHDGRVVGRRRDGNLLLLLAVAILGLLTPVLPFNFFNYRHEPLKS